MKKTIGLLLCFFLVTINLVSCSYKSNETSKNKKQSRQTVNIDKSTYTKKVYKKNTEDKKDDIITLTLVQKDFIPSDPDNIEYINKINKALINNKIEAKLELVDLPEGDYNKKLEELIDGGIVPDIIWFRDGIDKKFSKQEILLDLTDYINDSDVFQNAMEPINKTRIASYPYLLRIRYNTPKIAVVRKDWLDKLGLSIPETVDDYYKVLKAFANSDFDNNGEKDTYGITVTGDTTRLDNIFNTAFSLETTWIKENDKFIYSKVSKYEKEKLAFYRKLLEKKILDPSYVTTTWDTMEDKLYAGKVGMIIGSAGQVIEIYENKLKNTGVDTCLIPINPPKGRNGRQGLEPMNITREKCGFAISALSKNKDLAFKVLEFMASDKGQFLDRLGIEGKEYTRDVNGEIMLTEKGSEWYSRFFDVPSWESPISLLSNVAKESLDIANNYYKEDIIFDIPDEYLDKWELMNNLYKEYSYKIINGQYELNKFDEFVKRWYEMGGKEITKIAQDELKKEGKLTKNNDEK
jgi:putative aldouronate transport system substrate-binding protein